MTAAIPVSRVRLLAETPMQWADHVAAHFDDFLLDHAAAERKASAMAVSFVVQYPDKPALHLPLIRLAREELLHFQQVMQLVHQRELVWERDEKDPYIKQLMGHLSTDTRLRLLDRLLLGAVVEARGVERFAMVAAVLDDPELATFYERLAKSEANHADLFLELAAHYFQQDQITARLDDWLRREAHAMRSVPLRAALH